MRKNKILLILAILALIIGTAESLFYFVGIVFTIWYLVSNWGWRKFLKRIRKILVVLIVLAIIVLGFFAYRMWQGDKWGIEHRWQKEILDFPEQINNFYLVKETALSQLGQQQISGWQFIYQDNETEARVKVFQTNDNSKSAQLIEDYKKDLEQQSAPRSIGIKYGIYSQSEKYQKEIKIGGRMLNPATILEWNIPVMESESAGLAWNHQEWIFVVSCADVEIRDYFVKDYPY